MGNTKNSKPDYFSGTFGLEAINPKTKAKPEAKNNIAQKIQEEKPVIKTTTTKSETDTGFEICAYTILEEFPITFI